MISITKITSKRIKKINVVFKHDTICRGTRLPAPYIHRGIKNQHPHHISDSSFMGTKVFINIKVNRQC